MPPNPKRKKGNTYLTTLPKHLRTKYYIYLFNSITIFSSGSPNRPRHSSPTPNPLALLTVNHQTHTDTKNLWLPRVEFAFITQHALFTKLDTKVPDHALPHIRYITIWPLSISTEVEDWFYRFEKQDGRFRTRLCDLRLRAFTVCGTMFDNVLPTLERVLRHRPEWRRRLRCSMDDPRGTTGTAGRTATVTWGRARRSTRKKKHPRQQE